MKIIDEKGRLFGKINVIDFLVIIFLLSLTPMFYFGYKIFNKNPSVSPTPPVIVEAVPKKIVDTELAFVFTKLDSKTLEMISTGDKEVDGNGEIIGVIISLGKPRPLVYEIDLGNGQKLRQEDLLIKEIPAMLKLKVDLRDNVIYYKDKPIKANSSIDFKCDKYAVPALFIPPGSPSEAAKSQNEIKDILLPALEQKISALHLEMSNLKGKIDTMEAFLTQTQKETPPPQAETPPPQADVEKQKKKR